MEEFQSREATAVAELLQTVRSLRGEGGCPWDRSQTHESLRRYLIEETYEVLEALDEGDMDGLREELGDLLLQILFHAEIAHDAGFFGLAEVAADETEKMIRRHPHVFADAEAEITLATWEADKNREKGRRTLSDRLGSVPYGLPSLLRAQKYMEKSQRENVAGFPPQCMTDKILTLAALSEAEDPARAAGDFLLAAVAAFSSLGIECEGALAHAADRFFVGVKKSENPL